jgi:hypothetical protein
VGLVSPTNVQSAILSGGSVLVGFTADSDTTPRLKYVVCHEEHTLQGIVSPSRNLKALPIFPIFSADDHPNGYGDAVPHIGLSFTLVDFVVSGAVYFRVLLA